jgi:hypothetical protein
MPNYKEDNNDPSSNEFIDEVNTIIKLKKIVNDYYFHLTTNIFGIPGKTEPADKIKKVQELGMILYEDSSSNSKEKIEKYKNKLLEYKNDSDNNLGLATPQNPRWDAFINAICAVLQIDPIRKFLYGPFFKYSEGKKMIEKSHTIINDYDAKKVSSNSKF